MKAFRKYSDKYPFRQRSETPEIAVELSLQPWRTFGVDGVIMFSDILTPLPAMGIEFDVVKGTGPIIGNPLRTAADVQNVRVMEDINGNLPFVGETLRVGGPFLGMTFVVLSFKAKIGVNAAVNHAFVIQFDNQANRCVGSIDFRYRNAPCRLYAQKQKARRPSSGS